MSAAKRIAALRDQFKNEINLQKAYGRPISHVPGQRATRTLQREIITGLLKNGTSRFSENDGIDLLHTIVPVAYCEFALLDRYWNDQVQRVRRRFDKISPSIPLAQTFSKAGLEKFFVEMEKRPPAYRNW